MKKELNATDLYYLISFDVFRATEAGFILYAVTSLYGQRDKTNIQFHTNAANSLAYSYAGNCIDLAVSRVAEALWENQRRLPAELSVGKDDLYARRNTVAHPWKFEFTRHEKSEEYATRRGGKYSREVTAADLDTVGLLRFVHSRVEAAQSEEPFTHPSLVGCIGLLNLIISETSDLQAFPEWLFPNGWQGLFAAYEGCLEESVDGWAKKLASDGGGGGSPL